MASASASPVTSELLEHCLSHWGRADARVEPCGRGLINSTYAVTDVDGHTTILQRVNAIFEPGIHHNILAVTEQLDRAGLTTPRLLPTLEADAGDASLEPPDGAVERHELVLELGERGVPATDELTCSAGLLGVGERVWPRASALRRGRAARRGAARRRRILQRVNAIFEPGIHHNILAVTEQLDRAGLTTPPLRWLWRWTGGDPRSVNRGPTRRWVSGCTISS